MPTADKLITFTVTSSSAPPWVAASGIAVGTWARISAASPSHGLSATNNIDSLDPGGAGYRGNDGQDAVSKAYGGGCFATGYGAYGSLIQWNGGHNNYYGNEVYAFDMAARRWSRITEPYPNPSFTISQGWWPAHTGHPNGSPSVPHTYDALVYDATRNCMWSMRRQSNNTGSADPPSSSRFNFSTLQWTRGAWGSSAGNYAGGGWSAHDTTRDVIVMHGGQAISASPNLISYNCATDTFATHVGSGHSNIAQTDGVGAYNPDDDMIAVVRGGTGATIHGLVAGSLTTAVATLNLGAGGPTGDGCGWEWSPLRQAFIRYPTNGSAVWQLKKSGVGTWQSSTWSWTNLTVSATNAPEDMEANGVYSKFQLVRYGSVELAVVVKRTGNTGTGAVYAFRLS